MPTPDYRRKKHAELLEIATDHGIVGSSSLVAQVGLYRTRRPKLSRLFGFGCKMMLATI
jgi:hypothetical protein